MKRILIGVTAMMLLLTAQTKAQGFFSNFFSQKKAMLKNAAQQIAALKIYAEYLEKGYNIANKGLTTISDIKRGDLGLHTDHFNALLSINPAISKYSRVTDIVAMEIKAVKAAKATKNLISSSLLTGNENQYINRVCDKLIDEVSQTLDDLIAVVTASKFELTDDQRIARIDVIYEQMLDQYEFGQDFNDQVSGLRMDRLRQQREVRDSRVLYGLDY